MMPLFFRGVLISLRLAGFLQSRGGSLAFWHHFRVAIFSSLAVEIFNGNELASLVGSFATPHVSRPAFPYPSSDLSIRRCTRRCPVYFIRPFNLDHPIPKPSLLSLFRTFHLGPVIGLQGWKSTSLTRRPRHPNVRLHNSIAFYRTLQLLAFSSHRDLLIHCLDYYGVYTWCPVSSCAGVVCLTSSGVQLSRLWAHYGITRPQLACV